MRFFKAKKPPLDGKGGARRNTFDLTVKLELLNEPKHSPIFWDWRKKLELGPNDSISVVEVKR